MISNLKNTKVLFLEDNVTFAEHTIYFLELYVKKVLHCTNMNDAIKTFNNERIDIIISDLRVEDGIALDFIEKIRQKDTDIPIVVISAHKDEEFLLKAIPLGLTAYEIKPIDFNVFKGILEKCISKLDRNDLQLVKDNIFYDMNKKVIFKDNQEIVLSKKEALFVELLINNKNGITTKDQIAQSVWQDNVMTESALKNFLLRIRKKVGKDFFYTIQSLGYRL